jgi:PD-(D/E)XK nuclease superfamily protein
LASEHLESAPALAPALVPLERVSPTLGESLRRCFLQVAFSRDNRFDFLNKPNTAAALGLAAHEVAEAAAAGAFTQGTHEQSDDAFEKSWAAAIAREEERLKSAWPLTAIPPPHRWRGYELVHTRLRSLLLDLEDTGELNALSVAAENSEDATATHVLSESAAISSELIPGSHLETWLQDRTGRLFGRADRVDISEDGSAHIIDLKSGWALPDEMKPEHRRQLLLYAFLWHAEHGIWPETAAIQRLDGSRLTIVVEPAEAETVANDLLETLVQFNTLLESQPTPETLASPSADACQSCIFPPVCEPFFGALRENWGWYRRYALGHVKQIIPIAGSTVVELALESSNVAGDPDYARVLGVPTECAPDDGTRVAITNAIPGRAPSDVRVAWDSTIVAWP